MKLDTIHKKKKDSSIIGLLKNTVETFKFTELFKWLFIVNYIALWVLNNIVFMYVEECTQDWTGWLHWHAKQQRHLRKTDVRAKRIAVVERGSVSLFLLQTSLSFPHWTVNFVFIPAHRCHFRTRQTSTIYVCTCAWQGC